MDAKRATLRDVAAAAGVSRALAGFVLDHGKSIPEATRERVREIARRRGPPTGPPAVIVAIVFGVLTGPLVDKAAGGTFRPLFLLRRVDVLRTASVVRVHCSLVRCGFRHQPSSRLTDDHESARIDGGQRSATQRP
jgi:hypothetical protein